MYSVYIHIFPNNKVYIGVTGMKPEKRWSNGRGYAKQEKMNRAILKYGWENVRHEILYSGLSKEDAYEIEQQLIAKYDSTNSQNGYNNSIGGSGGSMGAKLSDAARFHISEGHKGFKHSEETKKKLSDMRKGIKNPNYGKVMPEETKQKRNATFAKTAQTKEYKEKMSEICRKTWENPEYRKKQSERMRGDKNYFYGKHLCGKDHPNYGKKLSTEQKENLRRKNSKPIICIETQTVFDSAKEAEKYYGVAHGSISHALGNPNKTSCGFHWDYFIGEKS